ncbi:prefoldin subunit beta [Candidatus Woesearchaeota archaeon]|nr:prefoldin subunit beta [Candidatus Woesearchaeota archaeon]
MVENQEQGKIEQLQFLEQNIQSLLMQKQTFQQQLMEIDSALEELEKTKGKSYKIVGAVMVESKKEDLQKELEEKKQVVNLRIKTIEKQETNLKEKASNLQAEVLKNIKQKEGKKDA